MCVQGPNLSFTKDKAFHYDLAWLQQEVKAVHVEILVLNLILLLGLDTQISQILS